MWGDDNATNKIEKAHILHTHVKKENEKKNAKNSGKENKNVFMFCCLLFVGREFSKFRFLVPRRRKYFSLKNYYLRKKLSAYF